jgi:hypothetical protein
MFPVGFTFDVIEEYTNPNDLVVDPFVGRGTSVYAAGALARRGFGVEINSVGWTFGTVKLAPARRTAVLRRLQEISSNSVRLSLPVLPDFFTWCYAPRIRRFLTLAREELNWRDSLVDRTAMSMLLLYAHGDRKNSLSNQMRQTKAMAPNYSVNWWKDRDLRPPNIDPIEFLDSRLAWRYRHGRPTFRNCAIALGDSTKVLGNYHRRLESKWSLLLTSPPYSGLVNYRYDQWLRMWLLGGPPHPVVTDGPHQGWFSNRMKYRNLLLRVFTKLAQSAKRTATVYVRTDSRVYTRDTTLEVLREVFPRKRVRIDQVPIATESQTQTNLYNGASPDQGEVDIVLR